jgi:hypothetical protein
MEDVSDWVPFSLDKIEAAGYRDDHEWFRMNSVLSEAGAGKPGFRKWQRAGERKDVALAILRELGADFDTIDAAIEARQRRRSHWFRRLFELEAREMHEGADTPPENREAARRALAEIYRKRGTA